MSPEDKRAVALLGEFESLFRKYSRESTDIHRACLYRQQAEALAEAAKGMTSMMISIDRFIEICDLHPRSDAKAAGEDAGAPPEIPLMRMVRKAIEQIGERP